MPIDYKIDHNARWITATAHGHVVLSDILAYFDAVAVEDAAAYPKLFDARGATFALSDDDVMVVGARASAYAAFDPRGPVALVATDAASMNMLRRYMTLGQAERPLKLFGTIDEARAWLEGKSGPRAT